VKLNQVQLDVSFMISKHFSIQFSLENYSKWRFR